MKLGVISDIHGNYPAYQSVINKFQEEGVDKIICLGDVLGYFHKSNEVIQDLINRDILTIMGNHEAYFLNIINYNSENEFIYNYESLQNSISSVQLNWLSNLERSHIITIHGKTIGFFHGSPWDPLNEYIYPDYDNFKKFHEINCDYIFLGHTHYPMIKKVEDKTIVNPGSCGLPRNSDSRAHALIFDITKNEKFQFIRESYDVMSFTSEAFMNGVDLKAIRKIYPDYHL